MKRNEGPPSPPGRVCRAVAHSLALSLALTLLAATLASTAHAVAQWDLQIEDSSFWLFGFGFPQFTVTNTSTAGEMITGLEIYVGDTSYFFDFVRSDAAQAASQAVTGATLLTGDTNNDGVGVDTLVWGFSDFQVGESMSFEADIDPGWWGVDARTILFNNGSADNATMQVTFDDNTQGTLTIPDGDPGSGSYVFLFPLTRSPEPRTGLLVALGLTGLAFAGRRPKRSKSQEAGACTAKARVRSVEERPVSRRRGQTAARARAA